MEQELPGEEFSPFRLFTRDSLFNIEKRIAEEAAAARAEVEEHAAALEEDGEDVEPAHSEEHHPRKPNTKLEVGKKLPPSLEEYFPVELIGKPIEDIDEYYQYKKTCCVIAKDKTIFRFSATNAFFILSIFNPIRRLAIYLLVHPYPFAIYCYLA
ncbi:hypothetical protein CHS0354_021612 [Potamilus streckersoni]|uniref:Uncharacterized protein n=1 Tax=Potamilus streckersoni TaxID=2493646 RepID=A0AAE0VYM9_9BIVA|nr:hypothetical protein CHS0354_021612 [Potamilus streckersoni]